MHVIHDSWPDTINVEHSSPGESVEHKGVKLRNDVQQLSVGVHVEQMLPEVVKDSQIDDEWSFSDTDSQFKYMANEKGLDTQRFLKSRTDFIDGPASILSQKGKLSKLVIEAAMVGNNAKIFTKTAMQSLLFAIKGGHFRTCSDCKLHLPSDSDYNHSKEVCAKTTFIAPRNGRKYLCVFGCDEFYTRPQLMRHLSDHDPNELLLFGIDPRLLVNRVGPQIVCQKNQLKDACAGPDDDWSIRAEREDWRHERFKRSYQNTFGNILKRKCLPLANNAEDHLVLQAEII